MVRIPLIPRKIYVKCHTHTQSYTFLHRTLKGYTYTQYAGYDAHPVCVFVWVLTSSACTMVRVPPNDREEGGMISYSVISMYVYINCSGRLRPPSDRRKTPRHVMRVSLAVHIICRLSMSHIPQRYSTHIAIVCTRREYIRSMLK